MLRRAGSRGRKGIGPPRGTIGGFGKGKCSRWQFGKDKWTLEHAWIKQRWCRGTNPRLLYGTRMNWILRKLGDSGLSLYPPPPSWNNKLSHYWKTSVLFNTGIYSLSGFGDYKLWSWTFSMWKPVLGTGQSAVPGTGRPTSAGLLVVPPCPPGATPYAVCAWTTRSPSTRSGIHGYRRANESLRRGSMDVIRLRELHAVAGALPGELAARAPGVSEEIQALRADALRRSLQAALETEAPEVRARVAALELPPAAPGDAGGVRVAVVEALASGGLPESALASAVQRLDQAEVAGALAEPLDPALPLDRQPLLAGHLRMAEVAALGQAADLADNTVTAVIAEVGSPAALDDATMQRLVQAGTLSTDQAAELGLITGLFNLLDADTQLAKAVRRRITSVRDLAMLTPGQLQVMLSDSAVLPPAGMTPEGFADALGARVAAAFPSDAFLAHVAPPDMDALRARLAAHSIEELRVVARGYPDLGVAEIVEEPGLSGEERAQRIVERIDLLAGVRTANPDVELLALDYSPGSPDLEALRTPGLSAEDRGRVIGAFKVYQRVHALGQDPAVSAALVEAGYLSATEIVGSSLQVLTDESGLGKADAQRVYDDATATFEGVTASLGTVLDLARGGTDWAAVANLGPSAEAYLRRLDGYATLFGNQTACRCEHCQSILSPAAYFVDLMHFVESQVLQPVFTGPRADSPLHLQARRPDLWTLPLTCANTTTSVPTLEIVNRVLEDRVALDGGFGGALADRTAVERAVYRDALAGALNSFRQPFWLPLERLETYLGHFGETRAGVARVLGASASVQTAAVLGVSSREADLLARGDADGDLLRRIYGVPFEIAANGAVTAFDAQRLLAPMGVTRDELGALLETRYVRADGPAIQIRAEKTTPDSVQNDIERIYGMTATALDRLHRLTRLWRRLLWSTGELDLLITYVGGGALNALALERLTTVRWVQERLELPVEELCALFGDLPSQAVTSSRAAFNDRRFNVPAIRGAGDPLPDPAVTFLHPAFRAAPAADRAAPLQQRLLAGLAVTDEILHQLIVELARPLGVDVDAQQEQQKSFALSAGNLALLYRHARLAERLRLTVPQLFQLLEHAGSTAPAPVRTALIHYRRPAGDYDDPARGSWGVHIWGDGLAAGVATGWDAPRPRARLDAYGAVFEVPVADPTRPVRFAIHLPGQDTVPGEREPGGDQAFVPSQQREVWLRQGDPTVAHAPYVAGLDNLVALLEVHAWWRESGYSLDDLGRITGGRVIDVSTTPDPARIAAEVVAGVTGDGALGFADTVFAFLPGVTEQYSREIIAANNAAIVVSADGTSCRLDDTFDPDAALTVPAPAAGSAPGSPTVDSAVLRAVLLRYHASEVVPSRLAIQLGLPVAKTRALLGLAGVRLSGGSLAAVLRGTGGLDPLTAVVRAVLPLAALFTPEAFDADAVAFVGANPALFGITDARRIDVGATRRLSRYAALVTARDAGFSTVTEPVDPMDVRAVLLAFTPAGRFATVPLTLLARTLRIEPGLAATIRAAVPLPIPMSAPEALDRLARCAALARHLGVGGDALATLMAEDYDALQSAADAMLSALRARYQEEQQLTSQLEPLDDRLRSRRRDALVEQLTRAPRARFAAVSDLYQHFLIDVEVEGCARTTPVAAAIGAVQLYVHRILLNLEQDDRDAADPAHVHVQASRILAGEWTWRKNYRVWEANRKVFLNPEDYLEPELRDDKTPLYEALEADLLQQDVTDENVLTAYTNYMAGFNEVANLAIAGVYHDLNRAPGGGDVMHLFGATSSDPPAYYYRSVENLYQSLVDHRRGTAWRPWRRVDVQVPDRLVAPVVFLGRLHLFWTQITTRPAIEITDGSSQFTGYYHRLSLRYTTLRADGRWTTPQAVLLDEAFPYSRDVGRIEDGLRTGPNNVRFPRLDPAEQSHEEARESYTLRGPSWSVYLQPNQNRVAVAPRSVPQPHGPQLPHDRDSRPLQAQSQTRRLSLGFQHRHPFVDQAAGRRRLQPVLRLPTRHPEGQPQRHRQPLHRGGARPDASQGDAAAVHARRPRADRRSRPRRQPDGRQWVTTGRDRASLARRLLDPALGATRCCLRPASPRHDVVGGARGAAIRGGRGRAAGHRAPTRPAGGTRADHADRPAADATSADRRHRLRRPLRRLLPRDLLPHPLPDCLPPQQPAALLGGTALVPLHLQPDRRAGDPRPAQRHRCGRRRQRLAAPMRHLAGRWPRPLPPAPRRHVGRRLRGRQGRDH